MWRGHHYDQVADPQYRWGLGVLDRLPETGIRRILDAGCGSGRITEQLLQRFRAADVMAIDRSTSMIDAARGRLGSYNERLALKAVDLSDRDALLQLGQFDAVLSTGTLHWVIDHRQLFTSLYQMMSGGGVLATQSGGDGSIEAVREILDDLGIEWRGMNNYAHADETRTFLIDAGFEDVDCWMTEEHVVHDDREGLSAFLLDAVIAPYVNSFSHETQREITVEIAGRLPAPELRFVRLNIRATTSRA
jgi:trans-aconitate 2-methyltransferase